MNRSGAFAHRTRFTPGSTPGAEVAAVRLWGELDLSTGGELDAVTEMCLALRPEGIRVDLTGLRFMDCAGLRHLEDAAARAAEAGIAYTLCGTPRPLVIRLLTYTGTAVLFASAPTPDVAAPSTAGREPARAPGRRAVRCWERVVRLSMLTAASGTVATSLFLSAFMEAA
ncbi:STAS domain-containing protein [Streptomyces sp. NPDC048057]|uniref:STAS domain-containing protein n=1 Tax=Streptomyces sp. NPDC048057 TaxID=3155628 RepID=UPI00340AC057